MARKRKIPARKHHGIRDPLKQLEEREKKLKNVLNNPPEKGDDQKISFKFAQFKKLADNAKAGKNLKRLNCGREDKPKEKSKKGNQTVKDKKFNRIKQFADEADEDYLRRVNRITTESLQEAQYEAKYGVTVVRDPKTGAITVKKRPKNEIDELLKQKQKEKRRGKDQRKGKQTKEFKPIDPKIAKELIKQAIKEDEEEKKKKNDEIIKEYQHDVIKFGEVVHAPPSLTILPRKATKFETVPRPGQKNNLLLKTLLNPTDTDSNSNSTSQGMALNKKKNSNTTVTKAQLKGKRKDLPAATRSMLETEQNKMIELYRNLKKSKQKLSNNEQ